MSEIFSFLCSSKLSLKYVLRYTVVVLESRDWRYSVHTTSSIRDFEAALGSPSRSQKYMKSVSLKNKSRDAYWVW